jgi:hypothetical protein
MLGISVKTVRLHLSQIGYVLKAFHWVSPTVTDDLKRVRVDMCYAKLAALRIEEHNQGHNVGTGEGIWFDFEYLWYRLWILFVKNAPDYPNRAIATAKHLLTNCWNLDGFHVVTIHPERGIVQSDLETSIHGNIMPLRDEFFPQGRRPEQIN